MSERQDFLQRAWATPEAYEIFRDEELGILIVPDIKPVVPEGQVLVVARQTSWDAMTPLDKARFFLAGDLVCEQVATAYNAERGTALWRLGNEFPTPHLWCFPRNSETDGMAAFETRPKATEAQLAATQQRVVAQFEATNFADELRSRLGSIILA